MTLLIAVLLLNLLGAANFWSVAGVIALWLVHLAYHSETTKK